MLEEITLTNSVLVPVFVSIATSLIIGIIFYIWNLRVNTPNVKPLFWNIVSSDKFDWIVLFIENQKGKAFGRFIEKTTMAENIKGVIKVYEDNELRYNQTLVWGLADHNPQEISMNVGEIQRLDVLIKPKSEMNWHVTAGRRSVKDPLLSSPPLPEKPLTIEIVLTGRKLRPIIQRYKSIPPSKLYLMASNRTGFRKSK